MKKSNVYLLLGFMVFVFPLGAEASNPLGAPNATILLESGVLQGNQSNNLGPAFKWVMEDHWKEGACPGSGPHNTCDDLRFGAAVFNRSDCSPGTEIHHFPEEDGAINVQDFVESNDPIYFCSDYEERQLSDGLYDLREQLFPGLLSADDATKDSWFEHPHLTLTVISQLPQNDDNTPGNQVRNSLQAACDLYAGHPGEIPSVPVWTMLSRKHGDSAVGFAELLAAAGGTGQCCDAQNGSCDPRTDTLDICHHIQSRTESQLRNDITADRYECGTSQDSWQTGSLDFEGSNNNLPQITCHLNGQGPGGGGNGNNNNNNSKCTGGNVKTDLFGKFACIRQLPRDTSGEDASISACDSNGCTELSYDDGDFEFIDANQTLISLSGDFCDATGNTEITVDSCPLLGVPCDTGLLGRCAEGYLDCDDNGDVYCEQLLQQMPEICNGRDDSCDGLVDNVSDTIEQLPEANKARGCFGENVCSCPDGREAAHYGHDLMSFIDEQEGLCFCTALLSEGEQVSSEAVSSEAASSPELSFESTSSSSDSSQAACAGVPANPLPSPLWVVTALIALVALRSTSERK